MIKKSDIIIGDTPKKNGMYIVFEDNYTPFAKPIFLTFVNGEWSYPYSNQKYRGMIIGYFGPMPVFKVTELIGDPNIRYAISTLPEGLHGCFIDDPVIQVKSLLDSPGEEGQYIFKLYLDKEAEIIGKWSDEKNRWLKKK